MHPMIKDATYEINSKTNSLLGTYKVFEDDYFDATAYLINKFQQRPIEFRVREFFERNELVNLNRFQEALQEEGIPVNDLYKRAISYNKKENKYHLDW